LWEEEEVLVREVVEEQEAAIQEQTDREEAWTNLEEEEEGRRVEEADTQTVMG